MTARTAPTPGLGIVMLMGSDAKQMTTPSRSYLNSPRMYAFV